MSFNRMSDLQLSGRRVMIREDLNVPMEDGRITSEQRILAALPTIRAALEAGARVMIMSHLGRPTEGSPEERFSLAPVAARLGELLGMEVPLARDWLDGVEVESGHAVLCENVRFNPGEKADDETLSRRMAALCDVFVMDAFGAAHRAQASTHGVARFAAEVCAGPLLAGELDALGRALHDPERPLVAIVGGAKVSTKLQVLQVLSARVDQLILGGGIANTFIAAAGNEVGKSLYEADQLEFARRVSAGEFGPAFIPMPSDVVVAKRMAADAQATVKPVNLLTGDDLILDIGPETARTFADIVAQAGTVVWNGPLGVFEYDAFAAGTRTVARAVAQSGAFSIAGGGETLAAIDKFGVGEGISYISTGGGAFLEFLEGKTLPAVEILETRAAGRAG